MRLSRFIIPLIISLVVSPSLIAQFSGGNGSPEQPYLVATITDLNNVRNYTSSSFCQTADITGAGILPIGFFYGTYDGQNFSITGVSVDNRGVDEMGLFSRVCSGATIKNVRLKNFHSSGQNFTGALAGTLMGGGSIINCSVEGGEVSSNGSGTGGLVGYADAGALVSHCFSTAYVNCNISNTYNIGGLVGENQGTIENSFASGPVGGYACGKVGGFVGSNSGTIRNCYSTGTVTGLDRAGGFCGNSGGGEITNCFAIGYVTGIENAPKGFCAQRTFGTFTADFWNTDASGCSASDGGTAVSDSLMGVQSMFEGAGWVFGTTAGAWQISPYYNNGYPSLYGMTPRTLCSIRPQAATAILTTTATVRGRVMGLDASSCTVYFLYGSTNGSYTDSVLAVESPVNGFADAAVSATLTGLTKGHTYYFTVSVRNSVGSYRGTARKFTTTSAFSGGAGTLADPYLIATLTDLIAMNNSPFKDGAYYFKQIADIDATSTASMNGGGGMFPIEFKGSYDGQGYSIISPHIDYSMMYEVGLFSQINAGQTISNVRLINVYIRGALNVGGLLGANNDGTVRGCSVSGVVYTYGTGSIFAGGCVGFNMGTIDQCYTTATVSTLNSGLNMSSFGGFVGGNYGTITNCYATGAVGYAKATTVGGFAGDNQGVIQNCYSTGHVTANYNDGGFVWMGDTVRTCFWDTQTSGEATSGGGTGKTTQQMKTSGTFTAAGWNFTTIWDINPVINNGYPQLRINNGMTLRAPLGDGSSVSPYQIATLTDLYWITATPSSWNKQFIQTTDIDAASTIAWDDSAGFKPIGNNGAMFSGVYDGQRHTISNLFIKRPTLDGVGFIGYKTGAVRNLGVVDVNITGGYGTGALVGVSYYDTVSGCWSTGSVKSSDQEIGGLVGENSYSGIINSYSLCSVTGGTTVGGLTGATGTSAIINCFSAGVVKGSYSVGGLTASGGTIVNSFWDMDASGMHESGGGTGKTTHEMITQSTFTDAGWDFWGETANGTADTWAILGAANGGYPVFKFQLPVPVSSSTGWVEFLKSGGSQDLALTAAGAWSVSSDQSWLTVTPASGTGNATLTLTASANGGETNRSAALTLTVASVPYALASVVQHPTNESGTEADPHPIGTYSELKKIGTFYPLSSVFRLTADIDASSSATENSGAGFMPIGTKSSPFTGSFHGGGHTIRNLTINRPLVDTVGLFGFVGQYTTIDSLRLTNVSVNGKSSVGGLAGASDGRIAQCSVTGSVQGSGSNTGGLVGYGGNSSIRVSDCYSTASVTGRSSVGGLIGYCTGQATHSYATGAVTGVSGGSATGGFVGSCYGNITECYAAGPVSGSSDVGGFAGANMTYNTITDCYASGSVTASGYEAGGFCGDNYGDLTDCYTTSTVSGSTYKGSIVGYMGGGSLSSTYWSKDASSLFAIGKRVNGTCADTAGLTSREMTRSARYAGFNFSSAWMIREDSTYPGLRHVGNNIPSAIADTFSLSSPVRLASIVANDCDIEQGRGGLTYKIISVCGTGSVSGDSTFTFTDEPKDSLLYRAGEPRAEGDTLWSPVAKVILINQSYVPMAGNGDAATPYLIVSYSHLKEIRSGLSKVYRLAADIDASASATEQGGKGFTPIGSETAPFTGAFHGGGHTIRNLHINLPDNEYVGFFGYTDAAAIVDSVGLVDAAIDGGAYVGALVGEADGLVSRCYTTGSVSAQYYGGGLVGVCSVIDRSFSTAVVTGQTILGGLAGYVIDSLTRCYATGAVASAGNYAGGLAAAGADFANCYATGSVSGQSKVGGLAGYGFGSVRNCYASGAVTGVSLVGGLFGTVDGASIASSYWNKDAYAAGIGADAGGTTCTDTAGLAPLQMQTAVNFSGWDFTDIWEIVPGGSPKLRAVPNAAMPVEISKFTVSASGAGALLAWSTATETDNYGFEIERMKCDAAPGSGKDEWRKIGFVQGNGTTHAPKEYSYRDRALTAGKYSYRLKQIDTDGKFKYSGSEEIRIAPPKEYALSQNYPNPFNPETTIEYQLPAAGMARLVVYDILGKETAVLVNEMKDAGSYKVQFDASRLSTGIYFYRLSSGRFSALKKMVLVK